MKRNFENAKSVYKYLKNRYGKFHNQTFNDDIRITHSIKNDHKLDQLLMMKKRINGELSVSENMKNLNIITFVTLVPSLVITIIITIVTIFSDFLTNAEIFKDTNLTLDQLIEILKNISDLLFKIILILIIILLIGFSIIDFIKINELRKLYKCSIILEEAIEMKKKELGEQNHFQDDSEKCD